MHFNSNKGTNLQGKTSTFQVKKWRIGGDGGWMNWASPDRYDING